MSCQHDRLMSSNIIFWWFSLCGVSALNVLAWSLSAAALKRRRPALTREVYAARRLQVLLSAGYVFSCAFRSVLPVFDVPRIVMIDTWLASIIVGRSVATIAELCFAMQWALLLRELSNEANSALGKAASIAMVPLIAVAEVCSWYSVLTTSNLGHVFEETLWAVSAAMLIVSLVSVWSRSNARLRPVLAIICAAGVAYIGFMFLVDVPMYFSRWIADESVGRQYMTIAQGVLDAMERRTVSHRWEDWQDEIVWMSLYFSAAVWLSIALAHVPKFEPPDERTNIRFNNISQPSSSDKVFRSLRSLVFRG